MGLNTEAVQSFLDRRTFLQLGGLGLASTLVGRARAAAAGPDKPNFVFILVDDMGWSDLGCYGNTWHETPRIDALARQGRRYTDAYAACPVCSPTRASILSGQYPARLGITDFIPGHWRPHAPLRVPRNRTQYLPHPSVTLPEALAEAGYASGAFGKWHLGGSEYFPPAHGFDESIVTQGWTHFGNTSFPDQGYTKDQYLSEVLTDEAEAFISAHSKEPFFLYLAHFGVHIPLEARQELVAKYQRKAETCEAKSHPVYAAMVEHIDQSVGRVLDVLNSTGLAENTVVVVFSDNGGLRQRFDQQGEVVTTNAPLRDEKGSLYEGGVRVPLIVSWPGHIPAGSQCETPVTSVDFYPTFLDLAGVSAPEDWPLDGISLVPDLVSSETLEREAIFWHYPHYHHSTPAAAVRAGDWKLIRFFENDRLELYNLASDPGETHNLAETEPERCGQLAVLLAKWLTEVDAVLPEPNPDYDPERQAEWGVYPGPE